MTRPGAYGTPCLVPVRIESADGGSARGFITRLAEVSAAVSCNPPLRVGSRVTLSFRRPSDNEPHEVVGDVVQLMAEGGLWRERPAALVKFDRRVDVDDLSVPRSLRRFRARSPERLGPDQTEKPPALRNSLQAGLGRRRRGHDRDLTPVVAQPDDETPIVTTPPDSRVGLAESDDGWEDIFADLASMDATAPPVKQLVEDETPLGARPRLMDSFEEDLTVRPGADESDEFTAPPVQREAEFVGDARLLDGPPRQAPAPAPSRRPAPGDPAPWEDDDRAPRKARVASSLPVTYWARGRSYASTARNFSASGLFLVAAGAQVPVRGATVRVEFPIQSSEGPQPVRFTAEVRWHSADRPQDGLPEGFGVQIGTFDTPGDRARYEALLDLIFHLDEHSRGEESRFPWGKPGGR